MLPVNLLQVSDGFPKSTGKIWISYSLAPNSIIKKNSIFKKGDRLNDLELQKVDYSSSGILDEIGRVIYTPFRIVFKDTITAREFVYQKDGHDWYLLKTEQGAAANP